MRLDKLDRQRGLADAAAADDDEFVFPEELGLSEGSGAREAERARERRRRRRVQRF
jgi:hypothetical protein